MSNRESGIINEWIILFLVFINAIIIKTAFIGYTNGYWLLLITLPLLLWFIIMYRRSTRKEKPDLSSKPWGKLFTHLKNKVASPGLENGVLHQPGKAVAFGKIKRSKTAS